MVIFAGIIAIVCALVGLSFVCNDHFFCGMLFGAVAILYIMIMLSAF